VGRDGELRRLLDLLDDAADGRPTHALISGDAGVGKTRLVSELAARAAARGFTVLSGRCAELGDSIAYLPLADALRAATTGPSPDQTVLDAIAARPVLGRLLPDRGASPPPADLPGLAQQQLFGAVLGMLAELADQRPVLLMLEDLHWADRSTRDLLTFLSRVLHRERVAVVVTYRTDDLHRRHPLRPVVAELLRLPVVTAIELAPLGYADMADHLSALAAAPLDATTLHRIVTRAEGNPYYGEELLAAGHVVVGIDNFGKYGPVAKSYDAHPNYHFTQGDAKDAELLHHLIADCDHAVALAAKIGGISVMRDIYAMANQASVAVVGSCLAGRGRSRRASSATGGTGVDDHRLESYSRTRRRKQRDMGRPRATEGDHDPDIDDRTRDGLHGSRRTGGEGRGTLRGGRPRPPDRRPSLR